MATSTGNSLVVSSTPMCLPIRNGDSTTATSKMTDFLASPSNWDQSPTSANGSPLSSLKNSFSMSSLSQHSQTTNLKGVNPNLGIFSPTVRQSLDIKCERPFNSLTRVRDRGAQRVQWRRSLGASPLQFKEEMINALSQSGSISQTSTNADWPALQADYTFLMSCDLIETCRSLNGEISGDFSAQRPDISLVDPTKSINKSVNPDDDVEPTTPDLHLELQILREWLKCMEQKVPKLVLRPKWTRDALERNIIEYKLLQREIEARSAQFALASQRCLSWNPRFGKTLENRYHRLLLRVLEWTFHLETLAKKPPEFWNGRRAALSGEESEHALPRKCPRLDVAASPHSSPSDREEREMRSLNGNPSGRLQAVSTSAGRVGIYEFKHADTDSESVDKQDSVEKCRSSKETKWIYSPKSQSTNEVESSDKSVRKKLDFDSDQSADSLCRYSSSESDWLQSGGLELSEDEHCHEDASPTSESRVYDKEKVQKLVTEAEQMVSLCGDACRPKHQELRYANSGASSECDASSELTSDGDEPDIKDAKKPPSSGRGKNLNRTYLCNEEVKRRVKQSGKQRPVSLSGLTGLVAQDDGAGPRGASSETALNHLPQSQQRFARKVSPSSEGLGSSCLSSCSSDKLRKRRPSARMRNQKASISRRDDEETSQGPDAEDNMLETPTINATVFSDVVDASPRSVPSDVEQVAHVDETSNFSEQAWDNYLDRYASEAYSEDPLDAECARRLLEFGEDYRNDLDSLSDCASSLGNRHACVPLGSSSVKRSPFWRRSKGLPAVDRATTIDKRLLDSDSDVDDFEHFLETSKSQLRKALNIFRKARSSPRKDANQLAELLATSKTNVECLQSILGHLEGLYGDNPNLDSNLKRVQDLIEKWVSLDAEVAPLHQEDSDQRQLSQELTLLKTRLANLEHRIFSIDFEDDFERNIEKLHAVKHQLDHEKEALLQANLSVHACTVKHPRAPGCQALKDSVTALYQLWDQLSVKCQEREVQLEDAERTWKELQKSLNDLQADIAADQAKLQQFTESPDNDPSSAPYDAQQIVCPNWLKNWNETQLNIQCDSGISSGSDGEFITIVEREKRLNSLKQLARKLENLSPGNAALHQIKRRIDKTRQDLIVLHNQLSSLPPKPQRSTKEISIQTDGPRASKRVATAVRTRPFWLRVARLAVPFQVAMVALLVAACVLQPSCCSSFNNFGNSLLPALKYQGGPPPV